MEKTNLKDLMLEFYRIGLILKYEKKPPDKSISQKTTKIEL